MFLCIFVHFNYFFKEYLTKTEKKKHILKQKNKNGKQGYNKIYTYQHKEVVEMSAPVSNQNNSYLPDSSGIIYSYVNKLDWTAAFRFEVDLKEDVDVETLNEAINITRKRFPTFFVQVSPEGKLNMLHPNDAPLRAFEEGPDVLAPFKLNDDAHHLIRIGVNGKKAFVEVFHTVSDGHAALVFFNSLLICYYNLKGENIAYTGDSLDVNDEPKPEEARDAFLDIYKNGKAAGRLDKYSYQYAPGSKETPLSVTVLSFSDDEIYQLAKKHNTSVSALLAATYIYSFYLTQKRHSVRPIRIAIPVDLRKMFPSETLRNFSLYIIVGIYPLKKKNWVLDDIIKEVDRQFKEQLTEQNMLNMSYSNVTSQSTALFKALPIPVKRFALNFGYNYLGEQFFTSTISSFGRIKFPDGLKDHVDDCKFILGAAMLSTLNTTAISVNGRNNIVISSKVGCDDAQKMFAKILRTKGINVEYKVRDRKTQQYEVID